MERADDQAPAPAKATSSVKQSKKVSVPAEDYLKCLTSISALHLVLHGHASGKTTYEVTGDTAFSLMDRYGIPYGWAGENLAENNYPLDQCEQVADDALWNSPPHRENILGPHYTQAGVGFAEDETGMVYFTVIFTR